MIERKKRPKAKKKSSKIWSIREKCVLLHRLSGRKVLMVTVVQLVRASDCGSECRGFESHRSPFFKSLTTLCCEGFFLSIYLLPLSLLAVRPLNHSATRLRSLPTLGMPLSSRLAFVVAVVRVERFVPDRKSAARLLDRSHTCPNARGCRKRFAPLHRRMRSRANRQLGWGGDAPGAAAFLEKTVGTCRNVHFLARGSACAHRNFSFFAFTLHRLV